MRTQLRRYEVIEGEIDGFLDWFPTMRAVRESFGFKVEFMYVDRENNQVVWAVSHPGDFDAAFEEFSASAEKAAALEGQPKRLKGVHLAMVDTVIAPGS